MGGQTLMQTGLLLWDAMGMAEAKDGCVVMLQEEGCARVHA